MPAKKRSPSKSPVKELAARRQVSRRRFLALIAGGSAATIVGARPAKAATAPTTDKRGATAGARALQDEIANQKKSVASAVAVIRAYKLPAGAPAAYQFQPVKAQRRHG
jgi:hypothetical protein